MRNQFKWSICLFNIVQTFLVLLMCNCKRILATDNLALLDGTLRTFQQAACDGEVLDLQCPLGTAVNIQIAHYGRASNDVEICNHHVALVASSPMKEHPVCNLTTNMQHALLHMVVDTCSKKRSCKIPTAAESLSKSVTDPCPTVPKFVEIAYKCRPNEFRSKIACDGESIQLNCKSGERIALFSANFGRPQEDKYHCPQMNGLPEEICHSSLSTEVGMKLCHGKMSCNLEASSNTFGNTSCNPRSRKYVRVIFTCVSRKILKDQYISDLEIEEDSREYKEHDLDPFPLGPVDNGLSVQRVSSDATESSEIGGITNYREPLENNEKLVIYLTLGIAASIVAILGVLVARLWYQRQKEKKKSSVDSKQDTISTNMSLPGFNVDVEDVDAEIDLTLVPPQEFYTCESDLVGTIKRDTRRDSSIQGYGYSSFSKSFDAAKIRDQITLPRSMTTYDTNSLYFD
ncbi:protein eva-1 homolog C-like isoform X2 [Artemia franciscana]|uniref:protein eva-1 homolog C-like isoform X2 n=1 Tax=Artemia franciscana TaxID=6661 RepID=UPI0032D9F075